MTHDGAESSESDLGAVERLELLAGTWIGNHRWPDRSSLSAEFQGALTALEAIYDRDALVHLVHLLRLVRDPQKLPSGDGRGGVDLNELVARLRAAADRLVADDPLHAHVRGVVLARVQQTEEDVARHTSVANVRWRVALTATWGHFGDPVRRFGPAARSVADFAHIAWWSAGHIGSPATQARDARRQVDVLLDHDFAGYTPPVEAFDDLEELMRSWAAQVGEAISAPEPAHICVCETPTLSWTRDFRNVFAGYGPVFLVPGDIAAAAVFYDDAIDLGLAEPGDGEPLCRLVAELASTVPFADALALARGRLDVPDTLSGIFDEAVDAGVPPEATDFFRWLAARHGDSASGRTGQWLRDHLVTGDLHEAWIEWVQTWPGTATPP